MTRYLSLALKAAISGTLIAWLFADIEFSESWRAARALNASAAVAALAALVAYIAIGALRWIAFIRAIGGAMRMMEGLRISFVAAFFSQFLPASVGSDLVRMWESSRSGLQPATAVSGVLLERLFHLATLAALAVAGLEVDVLHAVPLPIRTATWAVLVISGTAILVTAFVDRIPWQWIAELLQRSSDRIARDARSLLGSASAVATLIATVVVGQLMLSMAACAIVFALELSVSWVTIVALMPAMALLSSLPVSIAGWGVREYVMVLVLGTAGVGPVDALAVSLIFGLLSMLASIPGGIAWVMAKTTTAR